MPKLRILTLLTVALASVVGCAFDGSGLAGGDYANLDAGPLADSQQPLTTADATNAADALAVDSGRVTDTTSQPDATTSVDAMSVADATADAAFHWPPDQDCHSIYPQDAVVCVAEGNSCGVGITRDPKLNCSEVCQLGNTHCVAASETSSDRPCKPTGKAIECSRRKGSLLCFCVATEN
ncbi:MAG: hypothetical protein H6707_13230 [Deltaproteobacteria bacterium]|nr:hypothetical protein [Deltaproteobacteria bacterium]